MFKVPNTMEVGSRHYSKAQEVFKGHFNTLNGVYGLRRDVYGPSMLLGRKLVSLVLLDDLDTDLNVKQAIL